MFLSAFFGLIKTTNGGSTYSNGEANFNGVTRFKCNKKSNLITMMEVESLFASVVAKSLEHK
jgi:hypothetical protein